MIFAFDDAGKDRVLAGAGGGAHSGLDAARLGAPLADLLAWSVYCCIGRLRRVGERNLEMALPKLSANEHNEILRGVFRHLGWQLVEFCRMSRYTRESTHDWMRTEGLKHYLAAQARGKGVLVVTAHLGAWELSSFYHSLMGYPMGMVARPLDNRPLNDFVNGVRCQHGNRVLPKDDFARGLLTAMRQGETVGILMDTNMTPPQGEFVDFFGIKACTATGVARIALKDRRGGAARLYALGAGRAPLRAALRTGAGFYAHRRRRDRHPRRHTAMNYGLEAGFGAILISGCGFIAAGRRGRGRSRFILKLLSKIGRVMTLGELIEKPWAANWSPEIRSSRSRAFIPSRCAGAFELVFAEDAAAVAKALSSKPARWCCARPPPIMPQGKCVVEADQPRLWFARAAKLLAKPPCPLPASMPPPSGRRMWNWAGRQHRPLARSLAKGASIGAGTRIEAGAVIGEGVRIGDALPHLSPRRPLPRLHTRQSRHPPRRCSSGSGRLRLRARRGYRRLHAVSAAGHTCDRGRRRDRR